MEQLRFRADRFRKQGRLQEEEVEEIIRETKENNKLKNVEEGHQEDSIRDEQWHILKAVQEGLLQIHGNASNTKQPE
jgi:hypothetical protein